MKNKIFNKYTVISIVASLIIFYFLYLLSGNNKSSNNIEIEKEDNIPITTDKWYNGGNLHKAKIYEWKLATEKNKLATCGDFIAATNKDLSMDEIKIKAIELKNCIDESTRGLKSTDSTEVSRVASLCTVTLGHN